MGANAAKRVVGMVRRGGPPARPKGSPSAQRREPPQGVVTFLLTDIEGSSRLWDAHGVAMGAALARHEELVAEAVASHGGRLIKARGKATRPCRSLPAPVTR